MDDVTRSDVVDRLDDGPISDVVEWLKKGLRKDPYWADGHRLLGDLYLTELEHETYALVEYRKLRESVDELRSEDQLRLALANDEGGFPEKAARCLDDIDGEDLPAELTLIRTEYEVDGVLDQLTEKSEQSVSENADEWFEKHREEGLDYLKTGNPFEAQSAFEKALEYRDDPEVKARLAECLLRRRRYPRAVTLLKDVLQSDPAHNLAESLLNDAYDRLGLNSTEETADSDDSEDGFRKTG